MNTIDVLLVAVALSMDAMAVGMTDGMSEPKMPVKRVLLIAAFFGIFQAGMPLIGYFLTKMVADNFLDAFSGISSKIAFFLLSGIGAKMIFDGVREMRAKKQGMGESDRGRLSLGRIAIQAVATSVDALAVGITFKMAQMSPEGLFPPVGGTILIVGGITFALSVLAVYIGKFIGDVLADKAELIGGIVLIGIGVKLLLEGVF